jgi:hypothetical protein
MASDRVRAVPQPTADRDLSVPRPRPPVLDTAATEIAPPAPRPSVQGMSAPVPPPAPRPTGSRAGWILTSVVAAGAAWAVGWVAGVTWAWREMGPRHLTRVHRRRGASLPGVR